MTLDGELFELVVYLLRKYWSPEQIARTLKRMFPDDTDRQVSHKVIYNALYVMPRGSLKKELIACLRQGKGKRRPRSRGKDRRQQILDLVSIHLRPPEIENRLMPGHWEGDLIIGANNRLALGTLVERTTRLVILAKVDGTTATAAAVGFSDKLNEVPRALRLSMTYDQGREMVKHAEITQKKRPEPRTTSLTRIAHGNGVPMRTPTGCCGSTCRSVRTSPSTARKNSTPSPTH